MIEHPGDVAELTKLIAASYQNREPIELLGGGSRRTLGPLVQAQRSVSLSGLSGIELYKPNELVIAAKAGTLVATIRQALDEKNQRMTFEPPDYRKLLGTENTQPTLGGLLATNAGGPARLVQGAIRDVVLGIEAVNGMGEAIRSGGRVMKNVTGYDLPRLIAGSWGGLAALTQVTIKVLPKPPESRTLAFVSDDFDALLLLLRESLKMPMEVQAACVVDASTARAAGLAEDQHTALLRLEGDGFSLDYRQGELEAAFPHTSSRRLADDEAEACWIHLRDGLPFVGHEGAVWRLSMPPAHAASLIAELRAAVDVARVYADWAGGLVWLQLADHVTGSQHETLRTTLASHGGGHATLMRGPASSTNRLESFEPLDPMVLKLQRKVSKAFDPANILNPGRLYPGL